MTSKRGADDWQPTPPSSARRVRARALAKAGLAVPHQSGDQNMDQTPAPPAPAGSTFGLSIQAQNDTNEALFATLLETLKTVKRLEDRICALTHENKCLQAQVASFKRFKNNTQVFKPIITLPKLQTAYGHGHEVGFRAGKLHIIDKLKDVIESVEFAYEVKYGTLLRHFGLCLRCQRCRV